MHQNDALLGLIRSEVERVQTTFPGVVVSYNRARQTAVVQVVPRLRWRDPETDELVFEQVPQLPDVPILFPAGAGVSIVWDLAGGDAVWVVLADRCIGEWKDTGNADTEPPVPRRWDFSDAVAIPGGQPPAAALSGTALPSAAGMMVVKAGDLRLGSSGAVSAVALAPLVEADLNNIVAVLAPFIAAYNAAVVVANGTGVPAPISVAPATPPLVSPVISGTGATKVKAE